MVDQAEIHRMARSEDVEERRRAVEELKNNFALLPDKKQAWDDLIRLIQDKDSDLRCRAVFDIDLVFSYVPDKKQAWDELIQLTKGKFFIVQWRTIIALGSVFSYISDKNQAWTDLHQLMQDKNSDTRRYATEALCSAFSQIPDKNQAFAILHHLTQDDDSSLRLCTAKVLGQTFSHVPDKNQAWDDLIRLAQEDKPRVRASANYSLGRASIFKATEAEGEEAFRNELENALKFFEKSSHDLTSSNPAKFCLPFYRSFYAITFKKQEAQSEVQEYLAEAKKAVKGSKSKEKLIEAVENLSTALKEAQKVQDMDFMAIKYDLNTYMQYCERAADLLDATEEKAPGASRLIRRGLPIIDERIKGILAEIEENTTALCKQTKGTQLDNFGREIYWQGHNLPQIHDPIKLDKKINGMQNTLTLLCGKLIEENIMEELEILNKINDECYVENKVELMDSVMRRILIKVKSMKKIDFKINGNDNKINIDSVDNSINIKGDLTTDLETLSALIECDYKQDDRNEVLQTVNQMKQSCNDSSKKNWIKQKLGWIISRTSEVASISSFAISLLQNVK